MTGSWMARPFGIRRRAWSDATLSCVIARLVGAVGV